MEETDEEVDFRPRRPADDLRTVERGVIGDGERDWRLYELPVGTRRWTVDGPGVEKPAADGLPRPLGCCVDAIGILGKPLATRSLGKAATAPPICGLSVGVVLPVCGLGLFSLDFPVPPRALSRRSGVELVNLLWALLFPPLCRRVESNNQWVKFFQCVMKPCDCFLRTLFEASVPRLTPLLSRASAVVTRCSVEPLDFALRRTPGTPSLGGGMGLRRELLTDLIESLSIGGGRSGSGLNVAWDLPASGRPGRSVA